MEPPEHNEAPPGDEEHAQPPPLQPAILAPGQGPYLDPMAQEVQQYQNEPLVEESKNATVYVQNLNEKVRIPDLKNSLGQLFASSGFEVLEVHAKKNIRMRGQAFVVCRDSEAATTAIRKLRGEIFFGKPLRLNYAKHLSDRIAKEQGVYDSQILNARRAVQDKRDHERKLKKQKYVIQKVQKLAEFAKKLEAKQRAAGVPRTDLPPRTMDQPISMTAMDREFVNPGRQQALMMHDSGIHHTLFIANIPKPRPGEEKSDRYVEFNRKLYSFFSEFSGFKEVRYVKEKGAAFVEFDQDFQADEAMHHVKQSMFLETAIGASTKVQFAKKS